MLVSNGIIINILLANSTFIYLRSSVGAGENPARLLRIRNLLELGELIGTELGTRS